MGIRDEVLSETLGPGNRCETCSWVQQQSAEDRQGWDVVMADPLLLHSAIHRVMRKKGFAYGIASVRAHRHGKHQP